MSVAGRSSSRRKGPLSCHVDDRGRRLAIVRSADSTRSAAGGGRRRRATISKPGGNGFFRYKSIIGDGLRARTTAGQGTEAVLACNILNRLTEIGRPTSYRIGT